VSASVGAQSQTQMDNLVTTSGSIKNTFDLGIKMIGGMETYSWQGGISPDGMVESAYITTEQATAYNNAVAEVQNVTYGVTAQEYIDGQAQNAQVDMSDAISAYVGAASVLIEVVRVNEMAEEAAASGDIVQAQEVQNYIAANDVTLEQTEIDTYNDSLDAVQESAQTFAAFTSVANNGEAVAQMQTDASAIGQDFANANDATFDSIAGTVNISFFQGNDTQSTVLVDVLGNFKTVEDILTAGETSGFYTTGPTQNECFFAGPSEDPNSVCYDPNLAG
jgi:hypothetical protein